MDVDMDVDMERSTQCIQYLDVVEVGTLKMEIHLTLSLLSLKSTFS